MKKTIRNPVIEMREEIITDEQKLYELKNRTEKILKKIEAAINEKKPNEEEDQPTTDLKKIKEEVERELQQLDEKPMQKMR